MNSVFTDTGPIQIYTGRNVVSFSAINSGRVDLSPAEAKKLADELQLRARDAETWDDRSKEAASLRQIA